MTLLRATAILLMTIFLAPTAAPTAATATAALASASPYEVSANRDGGVTITQYRGSEEELSIPARIDGQRVTRIDANAFAGTGLTSVRIPETIREIGRDAFRGNELTDVTLGSKVSYRPADVLGQLRIEGNRVVGERGQPAQLRGTSLFHSNWAGEYYTASTINTLVDDFQVSVVRAAMNVSNRGGYLQNPGQNFERVASVVDQAIERGIYVIVDWHDHHAQNHADEAKRFFAKMAERYGGVPNVIYEIFNEPRPDVRWADIKNYAEEIVPVIREESPNALVIVGTPNFSSSVGTAARDALRLPNVAYALHFYAGGGGQRAVREEAARAYASGLPLFVTEWGVGDYSGDGDFDHTEVRNWMKFLDERGISHVMWSVSKTPETSAMLRGGAGISRWNTEQLSEAGVFIRSYLRDANALTVHHGAFFDNEISRIDVRGRIYGWAKAFDATSTSVAEFARARTSPASNPFGYSDIPGAVIVNPAELLVHVESADGRAIRVDGSFFGDGLTSFERAANPTADFSRYYRVGERRIVDPLGDERLEVRGGAEVTFSERKIEKTIAYVPTSGPAMRRLHEPSPLASAFALFHAPGLWVVLASVGTLSILAVLMVRRRRRSVPEREVSPG